MEGAGDCRGASASQNQTTHCVDLRIKCIVWVSSKQKRENTCTLIKGIVSHLGKELVERNDTAMWDSFVERKADATGHLPSKSSSPYHIGAAQEITRII